MKVQHMRRAIVLRPFMIGGDFALPGEEVELTLNEYRELMHRKKIRDLTADEIEPVDEEQSADSSVHQADKKDKK